MQIRIEWKERTQHKSKRTTHCRSTGIWFVVSPFWSIRRRERVRHAEWFCWVEPSGVFSCVFLLKITDRPMTCWWLQTCSPCVACKIPINSSPSIVWPSDFFFGYRFSWIQCLHLTEFSMSNCSTNRFVAGFTCQNSFVRLRFAVVEWILEWNGILSVSNIFDFEQMADMWLIKNIRR